MRIHPFSLVIVGCLGGALGWIAHSSFVRSGSGISTPSAPDPQTQNDSATHAAGPATQSQSAREPARSDADALTPNSAAPSVKPHVEESTGDNSPAAGYVQLPDTSSESTKSAPTADLAKSIKLWCRYDRGNGAHQREGTTSMYDLAYQGGPITYESIDLAAGTARMTGSEGATGSNEGILDVLAASTRIGLHFSAVNSRGELIVTTVFGAVDKSGHHPSVMTTHGKTAFNGSYQTYGSCDAS